MDAFVANVRQFIVPYKGFRCFRVADTNLYVSRCPSEEKDVLSLHEMGIRSLICLQRTEEETRSPLIVKTWRTLFLPTHDYDHAKEKYLEEAFHFAHTGNRCVIHCRNGKGRSRSCVYYILRRRGYTDDEARKMARIYVWNRQYKRMRRLVQKA